MNIYNSKEENFEQLLAHEELEESISKFNPSNFLIPGWKGEGLLTAHGLAIKSALNNLSIDALQLFKKQLSSNKVTRKTTFEEFQLFAESSQINIEIIKSSDDFWFHYNDETSHLRNEIEEFIKLFSFRAVAVYLFRIKFILEISKELQIVISEDNLLNPLSFLSKIFKKSSSTELNCESLQINQYSWYRPTFEYQESLMKLKMAFESVTLTELIKLLSTPKEYKIYSLKNYSHSLSHLSFGNLLNDLMIQLPKWINEEDLKINKRSFLETTCVLPKNLNTKFTGHNISSLALSHWLAQENNSTKYQWDNIICPEFQGLDFFDGQFLKLCHELQFLSFLTKLAAHHKYEVVPFICKIFKEKNATKLEESHSQASLFQFSQTENFSTDQLYQRIVLNLTEFPKTNPHHYLVQQILNLKNQVTRDGYIFVLSNQKLFVPSHSDRVELLLKNFQVLAQINLEELKAKGEIGNFIYVLKPKDESLVSRIQFVKAPTQEKMNCFTFEFNGHLSRFNKFNKFVEEFNKFLKTKDAVSTPIYFNELEENLTFHFHNDVIVEGKLVSLLNHNDQSFLHPSFFKNLTNTCSALENFFHIEFIDPNFLNSGKNIAKELLGLNRSSSIHHPLLLIVNQSDPSVVKIEITNGDILKAQIEKFGTAFFYYFGLTPKHLSINLNIFREYFNSQIGNQLIQMQLNDGPSKIRAKVKSLLVPNFFLQTQELNNHQLSSFDLFHKASIDLLKIHPQVLIEKYFLAENALTEFAQSHPWHILVMLSQFKLQIIESIGDLNEAKIEKMPFSNPLFIQEIVKLKTFPIYPNNSEVFVEIESKDSKKLYSKLDSVVLKNVDQEYKLELRSNEETIISLHSTEIVLKFLRYVLQRANQFPISDVIVGLKSPTIQELEKLVEKHSEIKEAKWKILEAINLKISQILRSEISKK